jgi:hypothetical protein
MAADVLLFICLFILTALVVAMIRVAALDAARDRAKSAADVTELLQRALYERRAERLGLLGTETNRRAEVRS